MKEKPCKNCTLGQMGAEVARGAEVPKQPPACTGGERVVRTGFIAAPHSTSSDAFCDIGIYRFLAVLFSELTGEAPSPNIVFVLNNVSCVTLGPWEW